MMDMDIVVVLYRRRKEERGRMDDRFFFPHPPCLEKLESHRRRDFFFHHPVARRVCATATLKNLAHTWHHKKRYKKCGFELNPVYYSVSCRLQPSTRQQPDHFTYHGASQGGVASAFHVTMSRSHP